MLYYLIMCRSVTMAQRVMYYLERNGIRAGILRAPYALSMGGCGYCVKVSNTVFQRTMTLLQGSNLKYGKVFRATGHDVYEEVAELDLS